MNKLLPAAIMIAGGVLVGHGQAMAPRPVHVTLHEGTNMAAALSPDGRTMAIDLLGTLWTMPAQGGAATAITDIFLDARQPSWSPDGRRIAFQAYRDSTWQIWTVNADGTDLKPVTVESVRRSRAGVVARRQPPRVFVRPRRQLRHLGADARDRRRASDHDRGVERVHAVVAQRHGDRVRVGPARQARHLCDAGD